ncbi:hypothetical protein SAMN04487944_106120 [Gracilibacillus ureilyticus]|uniref:Prenyltransferase and squalene oxidase repeat-containing protein n=1 Tax=Gracilibacillus ureilyticus TaxID=531814 RepID=A0A1H9QBP4_9BACI|nr:hypothetical protein [Gracilibacillus ureilyticus]SER57822.1 hypothetical protein SAMN04487944_106120 [Gracilibacillus ureilyticus]
MKISRETFEKTSRWLKRNARPLEVARWNHLFKGNNKNKVIEILEAYQNEDGGFGHGIEPDFWLPQSSPMASWYAGQILAENGADNDDGIVGRLIGYLIKEYDPDKRLWSSVLPENNVYPHAPWWHWEEKVQDNWMFNPSAELAAFILNWSSQARNREIATKVINEALKRLMVAEKMDFHEINNYQQLYYSLKMKEDEMETQLSFTIDQIYHKLKNLIEQSAEVDVNAWSTGYKPLPLNFVVSADDPFCQIFGDLIEDNLNFYIEQLTEEGIWKIPWSWEQYPDAFPVARRYWEGIIVVNRYKVLHAFNHVI